MFARLLSRRGGRRGAVSLVSEGDGGGSLRLAYRYIGTELTRPVPHER